MTKKRLTQEEKARREAEGKTQGREGCKLPRINMAFWTDNYAYIQVMARVRGLTLTDFVNWIIQGARENDQKYARIKEELSGEEVKPCPFCGGKSECRPVSICQGETGFFVFCKECEVETTVFGTRAEAIDVWNKRANG